MSSGSTLTRHKNVCFLKTFHCFIPARWTNQQAAGGALSSADQVTKKVAEGKGRVDTPAGHHPLPKTDIREEKQSPERGMRFGWEKQEINTKLFLEKSPGKRKL
jgi:hypothetical protein